MLKTPFASIAKPLLLLSLCCACHAADASTPPDWAARRDQLVQRMRGLAAKEGAFGDAYQPLYHAAIPWYELWGGRDRTAVDADMVAPEVYTADLADALEHGRNYFAENPSALFPLAFEATLPGGKSVSVNYWLRLPAGFPARGRTFPLVIGLHGSGWLGHRISFKRGSSAPDETFNVTPINMGGPWQIDFLNAYLDKLIAMLPIDVDRVYVQGHSLGAMATWEWALDNPERFAAIAPAAGVGEPYRASRLKNVPSWVIHGENDRVIPSGFADQMVTALLSQGASTRLTIIKGGEHNMPGDLDQRQVLDWYLKQTRSHLPTPPDPRDGLGLDSSGFSKWETVALPEVASWKTESQDLSGPDAFRSAAGTLFQKAHGRGEMADAPLREELDIASHLSELWLAVPRTLHAGGPPDPSIAVSPGGRAVRFFFRGETHGALDHLEAIRSAVESRGMALSGKVWITTLSVWRNSPGAIAEYCAQLR